MNHGVAATSGALTSGVTFGSPDQTTTSLSIEVIDARI
jgi:hypothetical protein